MLTFMWFCVLLLFTWYVIQFHFQKFQGQCVYYGVYVDILFPALFRPLSLQTFTTLYLFMPAKKMNCLHLKSGFVYKIVNTLPVLAYDKKSSNHFIELLHNDLRCSSVFQHCHCRLNLSWFSSSLTELVQVCPNASLIET